MWWTGCVTWSRTRSCRCSSSRRTTSTWSILRLDEGDDLRIFGSDSAFAGESRVGTLLLGDIEAPALGIDDLAAGIAARWTTTRKSRPRTRTPTRSVTPRCWPTSGSAHTGC